MSAPGILIVVHQIIFQITGVLFVFRFVKVPVLMFCLIPLSPLKEVKLVKECVARRANFFYGGRFKEKLRKV